jgi:ParB/Sulfiredoxin domain
MIYGGLILFDVNDDTSEIEMIKLGKNIDLKYIPFSELAIPWNVCLDTAASLQQNQNIRNSGLFSFKQTNKKDSKASRVLRSADVEELRLSIAKYGLLKPFEVAEMHERLDFFYGKGRYLVIDGQRRYFAIRELLRLPTERDEEERKFGLRTDCTHEIISEGEMQAQKQFDKLTLRDHVLIPCLVYPYTTLLQMLRHSIEDKRFSEKPTKQDLTLASKMAEEGVSDLSFDDLRALCEIRSKIEEERRSIEDTLQEIRNRLRQQHAR